MLLHQTARSRALLGFSISTLVLTGAWLRINWASLPDGWPSQYDILGAPQTWINKSWIGALVPLAVGAFIVLVTEVGQKIGPSQVELNTPEARGVRTMFGRSVGLGFSLFFSSLAMTLPFQKVLHWQNGLALVALIACVGLGLRSLEQGLQHQRLGRPEGYLGYGGIIYRNAADPRLWVPKAWGYGWTLNFGHRYGTLVAGAMLLPLIVGIGTAIARRFQ